MQLQILYKSVKSNTKDPLCPADARQLPKREGRHCEAMTERVVSISLCFTYLGCLPM